MLIRFECRDNLVQLGDCFWTEDIERRMIDRGAPVGGRSSRHNNLFGRGLVAHKFLFPRLSLGYRSALNAASPPKGKTWDVFILGRVPINEVYVRFAPLATTLVRRRNMSRTAKNRSRG